MHNEIFLGIGRTLSDGLPGYKTFLNYLTILLPSFIYLVYVSGGNNETERRDFFIESKSCISAMPSPLSLSIVKMEEEYENDDDYCDIKIESIDTKIELEERMDVEMEENEDENDKEENYLESDISDDQGETMTDKEKKKHKCDNCNKTFSYPVYLKRHKLNKICLGN